MPASDNLNTPAHRIREAPHHTGLLFYSCWRELGVVGSAVAARPIYGHNPLI